MKVWELKDSFGVENLKETHRADPTPGPGQVLVRVRAASLNYRDLVVIKGGYGRNVPLPLIPLSDGAGEIVAVGAGVDRVTVGDRVAMMFFQDWVSGGADADKLASSLGAHRDGVLAETVLCDQSGVVRLPTYLSYEEAACLPCAALTAWSALITEGRIAPGETVLVQGTGGVALFAVQIARMAGAEVMVISSDDAKLQRVRDMGASHGINYRQNPDWSKPVKDLTKGKGVDHVIEVGGAGTLSQSVRAVRAGGTISLIGVLSGAAGGFDLPLVLMRHVRVQGITVGSREGFEAMIRAFERHSIAPVVDSVFPVEKIGDALAHLESGKHFGKICLRFPE